MDDTWDSEGPSRVGQLTSSWSMTSTEDFLGSEYSKVQVYCRFESSNKLQWREVECGGSRYWPFNESDRGKEGSPFSHVRCAWAVAVVESRSYLNLIPAFLIELC